MLRRHVLRSARPALLAAALLPGLAYGSEPSPAVASPLTLAEAERRGLEVSPTLKAAESRILRAEGLLRQAGLYPNPDLALDFTRFTHDFSPKETILLVRQPFPWPGKRGLEKNAAAEEIEVARRDRDRARLDLLLQIREAYLRVYFAGKVLQLKVEDVEATNAIQRAVDTRVSAGDAAPLESLKASVEMSRAGSQATLARGELAAEVTALNLLLVIPPDAPTSVAEPSPDLGPPGDLPSLEDRALRDQPEVQAREHAALAAGYLAERSRLERRPDFAAGPTFGRDQGANYIGAGVSLRIPLWNRNQGNIAAAEAGRIEAAAEVDAARLAVSQLVADSHGRYQVARDQLLLYEQGLLSRTADLVEAARKSYEGGESGILDLLDARRTALAVREEYYRAGLDAALSAVRLRRAVGEEVEDTR